MKQSLASRRSKAEDGKELTALKDEPIQDKKREVRLKMSGYQEAIVFAERCVGNEVFEMLPRLDERIPVRWVVAGKDATTYVSLSSTTPFRLLRMLSTRLIPHGFDFFDLTPLFL